MYATHDMVSERVPIRKKDPKAILFKIYVKIVAHNRYIESSM